MSQPVNQTDAALLRQIRQGNHLAFAGLYDRYWGLLYRQAYNILHDDQQTQDLVQEVFCKVWANRANLDIKHPRAYLIIAVRNGVADYLKSSLLTRTDQAFLATEPSIDHVEEAMAYQETSQRLEALCKELPARSREVFYLSRFAHLSNEEIAQKLSMSKRTVEWHISESLKYLRVGLQVSGLLLLMLLRL